jgi:hypothetical protein
VDIAQCILTASSWGKEEAKTIRNRLGKKITALSEVMQPAEVLDPGPRLGLPNLEPTDSHCDHRVMKSGCRATMES